MDRWADKVAIVTGANSGIGFATANALVLKGMIVLGVDLKKEKMENEIKCTRGKGKFYSRVCDITKDEKLSELFEWVKRHLGTVHVLVNCAGIAVPGKFIDTNSSDWEKVINTNIIGLLNCCQRGVTLMKESGEECHIINICSTTGLRIMRNPLLEVNVYPATKYAVRAISANLEYELIGSKIRTTNICPGFVKTPIVTSELTYLNDLLSDAPALEPEDIAEAIIYILGTHPRIQINELTISPLGERM